MGKSLEVEVLESACDNLAEVARAIIAERDAEIAALRQQVAELQAYKHRVTDADKRVIRKVIDEEVDD